RSWRSAMIVKIFIFLLICLSFNAYACEVSDLTHESMAQARSAFVSDQTNPGTRIALSGMKDANKKYGLGTVNTAIAGYEQRLCNLFKNSQYEVKVVKTDFKGYFVQCSPMPNCAQSITSTVSQLEGPKFNDGASMRTSSSSAPNYQEGYIKAR